MLTAYKGKSREITKAYETEEGLVLESEYEKIILSYVQEDILCVRATFAEAVNDELKQKRERKPGVLPEVRKRVCKEGILFQKSFPVLKYKSKKMSVEINMETGAFTYKDHRGTGLFSEAAKDSRVYTGYDFHRVVEQDIQTKVIDTADGKKELVEQANTEFEEHLYRIRHSFEFAPKEYICGLGQHEEGYGNLREKTVYVHQANRKIAIPMFLSNKGYGILYNTYNPMIFKDSEFETYMHLEGDAELEYYFLAGGSMDRVVALYRTLTGKAVLLPKWAFGFWQSKERYETAEELVEVAKRFRKEQIGADVLVLDWISWAEGQWGQKSFDPARFPDPAEMMKQLHEQNMKLIISIWPNMDRITDNYRQMKEAGMILPGCGNYNPFEKEGRELYWKQYEEGIGRYGLDGVWCDNSEPFTPEWNSNDRIDAARLYEAYLKEAGSHLPGWALNAYGFYHALSVAEGYAQDEAYQNRRLVNLTRSGYIGSQRLGTILWSGDISADWKTLRHQIMTGVMFSASGHPYWTLDIGGFFVKKAAQWYWDGAYEETTDDPDYRELFARWYQFGAFLPIFRTHGTDCEREPWRFALDREVSDAIQRANELRYRLIPYIYSVAGNAWYGDGSIIKPLVFDYPNDEKAAKVTDQYLFGPSLMVCPVTESLNLRTYREVYLPTGDDWYDFYTEKRYSGGETIKVELDMDRIPVFVKAGSLIPMNREKTCTAQYKDVEIKIYPGKSGSFVLYDDDGETRDYEKGEFTRVEYTWDEDTQKLDCKTL